MLRGAVDAALAGDSPYLVANTLICSYGRVNYSLKGPPDGQLVVCFHGLNASLAQFERFSIKAAHYGFRVLIYDLWGHGLSDRPPRKVKYEPALFVAQFIDVLTSLHIPIENAQVDLVGFSLGGLVSVCIANACPYLIRKVVLLGPAGLTIHNQRRISFCLSGPVGNVTGPLLRGAWSVYATASTNTQRKAMIKTDKYTYRYCFHEDHDWRCPCSRNLDTALKIAKSMPLWSAQKEFAAVLRRRIPIFIAWGKEDQLIPVDRALATWNSLVDRCQGAPVISLPPLSAKSSSPSHSRPPSSGREQDTPGSLRTLHKLNNVSTPRDKKRNYNNVSDIVKSFVQPRRDRSNWHSRKTNREVHERSSNGVTDCESGQPSPSNISDGDSAVDTNSASFCREYLEDAFNLPADLPAESGQQLPISPRVHCTETERRRPGIDASTKNSLKCRLKTLQHSCAEKNGVCTSMRGTTEVGNEGSEPPTDESDFSETHAMSTFRQYEGVRAVSGLPQQPVTAAVRNQTHSFSTAQTATSTGSCVSKNGSSHAYSPPNRKQVGSRSEGLETDPVLEFLCSGVRVTDDWKYQSNDYGRSNVGRRNSTKSGHFQRSATTMADELSGGTLVCMASLETRSHLQSENLDVLKVNRHRQNFLASNSINSVTAEDGGKAPMRRDATDDQPCPSDEDVFVPSQLPSYRSDCIDAHNSRQYSFRIEATPSHDCRSDLRDTQSSGTNTDSAEIFLSCSEVPESLGRFISEGSHVSGPSSLDYIFSIYSPAGHLVLHDQFDNLSDDIIGFLKDLAIANQRPCVRRFCTLAAKHRINFSGALVPTSPRATLENNKIPCKSEDGQGGKVQRNTPWSAFTNFRSPRSKTSKQETLTPTGSLDCSAVAIPAPLNRSISDDRWREATPKSREELQSYSPSNTNAEGDELLSNANSAGVSSKGEGWRLSLPSFSRRRKAKPTKNGSPASSVITNSPCNLSVRERPVTHRPTSVMSLQPPSPREQRVSVYSDDWAAGGYTSRDESECSRISSLRMSSEGLADGDTEALAENHIKTRPAVESYYSFRKESSKSTQGNEESESYANWGYGYEPLPRLEIRRPSAPGKKLAEVAAHTNRMLLEVRVSSMREREKNNLVTVRSNSGISATSDNKGISLDDCSPSASSFESNSQEWDEVKDTPMSIDANRSYKRGSGASGSGASGSRASGSGASGSGASGSGASGSGASGSRVRGSRAVYFSEETTPSDGWGNTDKGSSPSGKKNSEQAFPSSLSPTVVAHSRCYDNTKQTSYVEVLNAESQMEQAIFGVMTKPDSILPLANVHEDSSLQSPLSTEVMYSPRKTKVTRRRSLGQTINEAIQTCQKYPRDTCSKQQMPTKDLSQDESFTEKGVIDVCLLESGAFFHMKKDKINLEAKSLCQQAEQNL